MAIGEIGFHTIQFSSMASRKVYIPEGSYLEKLIGDNNVTSYTQGGRRDEAFNELDRRAAQLWDKVQYDLPLTELRARYKLDLNDIKTIDQLLFVMSQRTAGEGTISDGVNAMWYWYAGAAIDERSVDFTGECAFDEELGKTSDIPGAVEVIEANEEHGSKMSVTHGEVTDTGRLMEVLYKHGFNIDEIDKLDDVLTMVRSNEEAPKHDYFNKWTSGGE